MEASPEMPVPTEMPSDEEDEGPEEGETVEAPTAPQDSAVYSAPPLSSPTELPVPTEMPSPGVPGSATPEPTVAVPQFVQDPTEPAVTSSAERTMTAPSAPSGLSTHPSLAPTSPADLPVPTQRPSPSSMRFEEADGRLWDIQRLDDVSFGTIVQAAGSAAGSFAKRRPVGVSLWALGLLLASFAKGFTVDQVTEETYFLGVRDAQKVRDSELSKALHALDRAERTYYNSKGWFWQCDQRCMQNYDKYQMAKEDTDRVQRKVDKIMQDARQEVGIWSSFGVQEVRGKFWAAWQSGKDLAMRYTMMDAVFMMIGGKEETLVSVLLKLAFQYAVNLTVGLVSAFFFFMYHVYSLLVNYGEPMMSGLAFFLLVLVAAASLIGTYLITMYGVVAGGGFWVLKQAAKHEALNEGRTEGLTTSERSQRRERGEAQAIESSATKPGLSASAPVSPSEVAVPTQLPSPTMREEEIEVDTATVSARDGTVPRLKPPSSPADLPVPTQMASPTSLQSDEEEEEATLAAATQEPTAVESAGLVSGSMASPSEMAVPTFVPSPEEEDAPDLMPEPTTVPVPRHADKYSSALLSSSVQDEEASPTEMPVPTELPSPTSPADEEGETIATASLPTASLRRPAREVQAGRMNLRMAFSALSPSAFSRHANWLVPGQLMVGRYPYVNPVYCDQLEEAEAHLAALLEEAKVSTFVCLQSELPDQVAGDWPARGVPVPGFPGRFLRYADAARQVAKTELCFLHAPVPDLSTPQVSALRGLLDDLKTRIDRGEVVYLHCWGGRGRSGVVGACLLGHMFPKLTGEESLRLVQEGYTSRGDPLDSGTFARSPQTEAYLPTFAFQTGDASAVAECNALALEPASSQLDDDSPSEMPVPTEQPSPTSPADEDEDDIDELPAVPISAMSEASSVPVPTLVPTQTATSISTASAGGVPTIVEEAPPLMESALLPPDSAFSVSPDDVAVPTDVPSPTSLALECEAFEEEMLAPNLADLEETAAALCDADYPPPMPESAPVSSAPMSSPSAPPSPQLLVPTERPSPTSWAAANEVAKAPTVPTAQPTSPAELPVPSKHQTSPTEVEEAPTESVPLPTRPVETLHSEPPTLPSALPASARMVSPADPPVPTEMPSPSERREETEDVASAPTGPSVTAGPATLTQVRPSSPSELPVPSERKRKAEEIEQEEDVQPLEVVPRFQPGSGYDYGFSYGGSSGSGYGKGYKGDGKGYKGAGKDYKGAGKDYKGFGKDYKGDGKGYKGYKGAGKDYKGAGKDFKGAGKDFKGAGKDYKGDGKGFKGAGKDYGKSYGKDDAPVSFPPVVRRRLEGQRPSPSELPVPTDKPSPTSPARRPEEAPSRLPPAPPPPPKRAQQAKSPSELPVPTDKPSPTSPAREAHTDTETRQETQPTRDEVPTRMSKVEEVPVAQQSAALSAMSAMMSAASSELHQSPTEMPVPTEVPSPTSPAEEEAATITCAAPATVASVPTRSPAVEPEVQVPPESAMHSSGLESSSAPVASPTEMPVPTDVSPTTIGEDDEQEPTVTVPTALPEPTIPTVPPPGMEVDGSAMASAGYTSAPPASPEEMPVPTELPSPTSPADAVEHPEDADLEVPSEPRSRKSAALPSPELVPAVQSSAMHLSSSAMMSSSVPQPHSPTEMPVPTELPSPTSPGPEGDVRTGTVATASQPRTVPTVVPEVPVSGMFPSSGGLDSSAPVSPGEVAVPTELPSPTSLGAQSEEENATMLPLPTESLPTQPTATFPTIQIHTREEPTDLPIFAARLTAATARAQVSDLPPRGPRVKSPTEMPVPSDLQSPRKPPVSAVFPDSAERMPSPTEMPVPTDMPSPTSPADVPEPEDFPTDELQPPQAPQDTPMPRDSALLSSSARARSPSEMPVPTEQPHATSPADQDGFDLPVEEEVESARAETEPGEEDVPVPQGTFTVPTLPPPETRTTAWRPGQGLLLLQRRRAAT
ncbi:unnamed protein product [Effrenium voratum]|uniref:Swiss Army Knife protein DSP-PTPase phosphatase domain-containing protein n=1 Tax=Effrenium voratum TaxID=2562239 RepID=A0AA36HXJ0_9DINO|nr:unnamed protein product [Effrenium voratum]